MINKQHLPLCKNDTVHTLKGKVRITIPSFENTYPLTGLFLNGEFEGRQYTWTPEGESIKGGLGSELEFLYIISRADPKGQLARLKRMHDAAEEMYVLLNSPCENCGCVSTEEYKLINKIDKGE